MEAAIDPGAELLDSVQTDLAFGSIFEHWLRGRLDNAQSTADPIPGPYERNAAISRHFERDPIPYALETNLCISKSDLLNFIPPQRDLGIDRARP